MNAITLDSLRGIGMKILLASVIAQGLATIATDLLAKNDHLVFVSSAIALALMVYPVMLVRSGRTDAEARMSMTMAVSAMPILLIYTVQGHPWQIDLHLIFFAGLAFGAILCDARAIIAATAVIAVHHLGFGMIVPEWVFYGGGGIGRILLHAVILVAEAAALVWMSNQLVALLASIAREQEDRQRVEAAAAAERAARLAELQSAMSTLSGALTALRDGRLTVQIPADFPPAYARLRDDYHAAVDALRGLVGGVAASAGEIDGGTAEIAAAAEDLAVRSQSNAASIEETTAAIGQIDERLKTSAQSAERTLAEAGSALDRVMDGRQFARTAVDAMAGVSESAQSINTVMEGLDAIAFQTQVLAMNAAIEASRAGPAGAGFAVVAELVGQLARRSEEESANARLHITATQEGIAQAAETVRRVEDSFDGIAGAVEGVQRLVAAMAEDNKAQSLAISEINGAILTMDRAVQQNAAMVEESSAATRRLSEAARALLQRTLTFDIGQAGGTGRSGSPGHLRRVA